MNVWKNFCRMVESKQVRRNFGDLVPLVDTCAVFELSAAQITSAVNYVPDELIQPFPFPRMCCVGPAGVILLQNPTLDTSTDTLEFTIYVSYDNGAMFQTGVCSLVRSQGLDSMAARDVQCLVGGRLWSADQPSFPGFSSTQGPDPLPGFRRALKDARAKLVTAVEAEREQLRADVELLETKITEYGVVVDQLRQIEADLHEKEKAHARTQVETIREAFLLGLKEVAWINKPTHYTVQVGEDAPRPRKPKKGARVRRLADRARHIILTKEEIGEAWHRTHLGGTHASPIPHLRRGHYRTIRSTNGGTRQTWVRAAHVNGKCVEWREGDVVYKVL